eukprot:gene18147-23801_t
MHKRAPPKPLSAMDKRIPKNEKYSHVESKLDTGISKNVAKTLVDRGIDNIFLLTGGIKDFILSYPEFIEGVVPPELLPAKKPDLNALSDDRRSVASGRSIHSNAVSPSNRSSAIRSTYRSSIARPLKYREDRSDAGVSMMSNRSVAESVISQSIARKGKF